MNSGRTISMDYRVYETDLKTAEEKGYAESVRRFKVALGNLKKDPRESFTILLEDFGNEGYEIAKQLGIKVEEYE